MRVAAATQALTEAPAAGVPRAKRPSAGRPDPDRRGVSEATRRRSVPAHPVARAERLHCEVGGPEALDVVELLVVQVEVPFLVGHQALEQLLEVLVGVTQKTLSNYVNHLARTPLDTAFNAHRWSRPGAR